MKKVLMNVVGTKFLVFLLISVTFLLVSCAPSSTATTTTTLTILETLPTYTTTSETTLVIMPTLVNPTPAHPNMGIVTGHVLLTNNTPASSTWIAVYKRGQYLSEQTTWTNNNGGYNFSNLPVGYYDIQPVLTYDDEGFETQTSSVFVQDQQTVVADTIIVPIDIDIYCNGSKVVVNDFTTSMVPMTVSWNEISKANDYTVVITSTNPKGYDKSTMSATTNLLWPALEFPGYYQIVVKAFDGNNVIIAVGRSFFQVK